MAATNRNIIILLTSATLLTNSIREMYRTGKLWSTRFMSIFQIVLAFALMMFLRAA
jgi:hypothetical protein